MNQKTITINEMLYGKMRGEYLTFLEELETKEPKEIIACAYEKVFKEDILMCIEENNLPYEKAKALLRESAPLDSCYRAWIKSDCSYMEDLWETIEHHARETEEKHRKNKERSDGR